MGNTKRLIAKLLLDINAIKLSPKEPFTWASGIKSPIYCDNRITLSHPNVRLKIKEAFVKLCTELEPFDVIGGVATAGIPHGALLADALNKPFIYVRSKKKEHGRQNKIEGEIQEGNSVVLVEDLISTGMSSLEAAHALEEQGVKINSIISIFTYGFEETYRNFENKHTKFISLTDFSTLIDVAKEEGMLSDDDLTILKAWFSKMNTQK